MATAAPDLQQRIRAREQWYHTLELAPGLTTPGWFDLRTVAPRVLPPDLTGKRCLDVGTFDGFWAFELERRGASEVVAIDIVDPRAWDWPVTAPEAVVQVLEDRKQGGAGFTMAAEALGSQASYRECSVYDLDPEDVGTFDVVFMGSLVLHLRDPIRALERLRAVCAPDGIVITLDAIDPTSSLLLRKWPMATFDGDSRPYWWLPNLAGYERMLRAGGLEPVGPPQPVRLPPGPGQPKVPFTRAVLANREGRRLLAASRRGDAQAFAHSRVGGERPVRG